MLRPLHYILLLLPALASLGCQKEEPSPLDETPYELHLPAGFPYPDIPEDNQLTLARVALGKRLFYDPVLSADSTVSCASCHRQSLAFADAAAISPGVKGRLGFRNAPTLANVAYITLANKDGGVPRLDLQPLVPIEDENEMALFILDAARRLNALPGYQAAFQKAYGQDATAFTITRALSAFMRTFISGNSPYDRYDRGEGGLSESAQRGMALFFGNRAQCGGCHSGFNFTDNDFHNNGLYETYADPGRMRATFLPEDEGKFRVPTLRNIALTAPYMHDGSLATLEDVISHYDNGGSQHPNKDPRIRPLGLSDAEKADILAFLQALTDTAFITNPAFLPD
ncbi:MAG: c-type cytochrome [Phaeodactylibacter sp.]|nr:c-type cytochrome [Phaeodactylibacter sp.]